MSSEQPAGRIETLNGTELYFEVHGTGEPLVLLHGFSGSSQDWKEVITAWRTQFQLIVPDLRGHGRSGTLSKPFRHREAAAHMLALLDSLKIDTDKGLGVSGGGNVLLHLATMQPERVKAMVLVSATPYFPAQARPIMRQYAGSLPEQHWEILRRSHPGGDAQIRALLASTEAFADSYDDIVEMARAIPQSSLWMVQTPAMAPYWAKDGRSF